MGKIGFLVDRAVHMDHREILQVADTVHRETGKPKAAVLADICRCAVRYGAGFNDYLLCQFYNLTDEQRATYVTRGVNQRLMALLNDPETAKIFDSKSRFYRAFGPYLGRDWLDLSAASPADFAAFLEGREAVMVKPDDGTGGHGVEKLLVGDFPSARALYDRAVADGAGVAEGVLAQHPALDAMNPSAVNTLRIATLVAGEDVHLMYAYLRIGGGDKPVDNLHSGGMFAPVDFETGKLLYPAYDKARRTFTHHPKTGTAIQGFQIPLWEEAKALCLKAAQVAPKMRYVGWDVGVTPDGPVLVEGNNFPGYDILQMPPHTPDKIGMLPAFRKYVEI